MSRNWPGKVLVLMGGLSAEREISLRSGAAVLQALQAQHIDARALDVGADVIPRLLEADCDRVFIALHGRGGEDGQIQAVLQTLGLPYTGTGVLGSALGMDKIRSKHIWRSAGLPTPDFDISRQCPDADTITERLGWPVMVKPSREGSSIGISKVDGPEQLLTAWKQARRHDPEVLIEAWVEGGEYTVPILNGEPLPTIRLETPRAFYDFVAKYQSDETRYLCPCGLPSATETAIQALAVTAFAAIGGAGWGRVDLMLDSSNQPHLIEVNTVPGMTDHSLVPMAARQAGIDFEALVLAILATSRGRDDE